MTERAACAARLSVGAAAFVGVAAVALVAARPGSSPAPGLVYRPTGYGGYGPKVEPRAASRLDPLRPALEAIERGAYPEAEHVARSVAARQQGASRQQVLLRARAVLVAALSAARQGHLERARLGFAAARADARATARPGESRVADELQAEAAYQHAVCTAAMDDKRAAELEYMELVRLFPTSRLVHAAARRIAAQHAGALPAAAQAVVDRAARLVDRQNKAALRARSMCGPACLAEVLRRSGRRADRAELARQMRTSHEGTSLADLAATAARYGVPMRGLLLNRTALRRQALPALALVDPGHLVVIVGADQRAARVWDPDGRAPGVASERAIPWKDFEQVWRGPALVRNQVSQRRGI